MMNLKGQYNKLDKRQKYILKIMAIKKEWNKYWYFKKMFLISYEKTLDK